MVTEYLHQLYTPQVLPPGRSRLVNESLEESVVRFCVIRQHDKAPATMSGILDFLSAQGRTIDRFWVPNFVQQQKQRLRLQTAKILEKDRHDVSLNDIKQYFDTLGFQIRSISSVFVWNADETRIGCPKKTSPPEVIIAINPKLNS